MGRIISFLAMTVLVLGAGYVLLRPRGPRSV